MVAQVVEYMKKENKRERKKRQMVGVAAEEGSGVGV